MDPQLARDRFAARPVARLGTVRPDGRPHLVPVTFAVLPDAGHDAHVQQPVQCGDGVSGDVIVFAVDHKPKRTQALRRLGNIAASPRVTFLADHYADDWTALWWVRADAVAEILLPGAGDPRFDTALDALAERYPQYRARRPEGPVVWSTVTGWTGWAAS